jgi:PAS domain S-box-containing protein
MFDKEFLKTLTIMYVEDDESIRASLSGILTKIFGEVIVCVDGQDGLEKFKQITQVEHRKIDAIISDINMPNKNGIEMIQGVRELDDEIPVIFTTAHGESNYLMEAIKLKIAYYALKPINTTELLQNVSKFCMIEHNKRLVQTKDKEISQYMEIMNNITSIFKIDTQGKITEANELLCEISQYTQDELLNMTIDDLLHKDSVIKTYDDTLQLIKDKDIYKGKIKFMPKDQSAFFLNTTIIPIQNDSTGDTNGYIYIGIDQTNDELEKQQTMQRVRKNIMEQRTKEATLQKRIKELEAQLQDLQTHSMSKQDTQMLIKSLNKEKQKVAKLMAQIGHYEQEILELTKQKNMLMEEDKEKKLREKKQKEHYLNEKEKFQSKIIELQAKISKLEAKLKATTLV